jgi:hypothetical protein
MDRTSDWKVVMMEENAQVEEVQATMVISGSDVSWLECSQGSFIRIYERKDDNV